MKVSQVVSTIQEVNLTEDAVKEVTMAKLKQMLLPGQFIREEKGKMLLKKDEDDWRHGSVSEDVVREATETDLAIWRVLRHLKGLND